jgi:protocatechuate 3,4-dioxygenase beta subunit
MHRALLACAVAVTAAVAAASGSAAATCTPTANDGGGPDRSPPLRAKIGTGHVLTGVVLAPTCAPIRGARVSFWQSNSKGLYSAAGGGAVITGTAGRFRFQGPRPTSYGGFPAHIHIKVEAPGFVTLFTEYFPPPGSTRGRLRLVLLPDDL